MIHHRYSYTMTFSVLRNTNSENYTLIDWTSGNAGHLQLKESLGGNDVVPDIWLMCKFTNVIPESILNAVTALVKSATHIQFITGVSRVIPDPWAAFRSKQRSFRDTIPVLACPGFSLSLEDGETSSESSSVTSILRIKVSDQVFKPARVLASIRRLVNLLEWASSTTTRLKSGTPFKWETFARISSKKVFVQ